MEHPDEVLEIRCGGEAVRFPGSLLARYDVPGPRYTSYPTAPEWSDDFGPADMLAALEESNPTLRPLSLYMHLPFCQRLCLFCGCNVVISRHRAVVAPYVEHLKREVDAIVSRIARERSVVQFHWGGGAPTYLSPAELEDLFLHVRSRFRFSHDAEVSVENGLTPPASVQ